LPGVTAAGPHRTTAVPTARRSPGTTVAGGTAVPDARLPGARLPGARLPGLDALRGIAIVLVMLTHADGERFGSGGMLGVTLFFTLSGYLITGVLLRDLEPHGRVRYGRFFGARALRLLPPLLLVLLGYLVVEGVLDHFAGRAHLLETVLTALTYTANLPYLAHGSGAFFHLWTLATEEQFYLVWPLVLAFAWQRGRTRLVVALGVVGSLALCAATVAYQWPDVARVYALPTSWSVALVVGCALRLGSDRAERLLPRRPAARRWLAGALVAALVLGSAAPGLDASPVMYLLLVPATAVASAALILLTADLRGPARGPLRLLVALGTVSYAAYLWNLPIQQWLGDPQDLAGGVLGATLTLLAATASWWVVERPAARLRHRLHRAAAPHPAIPAATAA
jgi:peptidoglycan/LPS O-acetylase OafA/YrhL